MKAPKVRVTLYGGPRHGQMFWYERPKPDAVLLRIVGDPHSPNSVARYEFDPMEHGDIAVTARFVCFMDPLPDK